ncbi:MAG: hemerythrin domain-containing protein [Polyangiaceae bacterium]
MNAPGILIGQHRAIRDLFQEITAEAIGHVRGRLASWLAEEIIAHMAGEEAFLYPAARRALPGERSALEGARDRDLALRLQLRRFLGTSFDDPTFNTRLEILREVFDEHVQYEETELFPRLDTAMGTEALESLGVQALASRPPIWIVTTEGQPLARPRDTGARRVRVSLPSIR